MFFSERIDTILNETELAQYIPSLERRNRRGAEQDKSSSAMSVTESRLHVHPQRSSGKCRMQATDIKRFCELNVYSFGALPRTVSRSQLCVAVFV